MGDFSLTFLLIESLGTNKRLQKLFAKRDCTAREIRWMKRSVAFMLFLSVLLFTSCSHKDLDFNGVTDLTVVYDWSQVSSANPSSMMLNAFSEGSQPIQKPMLGSTGGTISLPINDYELIAFNDDTEDVSSRGVSWTDYEVYAHQTELSNSSRMFAGTRNVPRGSGTEDQLVINQPDEVWTSAVSGISVTGSIGKSVTMQMEPATFVIRFTIKNVSNIEFVNDVLATVSGMAGSWWPAQHACSYSQCIIPFSLKRIENSYTGEVRTFGYRSFDTDGNGIKHLFVIYAELTDGSKKYYTFDVTDQMNRIAPADGGAVTVDVEITLDELPLPKPLNDGTGLEPDVQDWEEVPIGLNM